MIFIILAQKVLFVKNVYIGELFFILDSVLPSSRA